MQTLLHSVFKLDINDVTYKVSPPVLDTGSDEAGLSGEELKRMGDVRALVGQLYEV